MNFDLLVAPISGAIIGYITNGIAIRMLFRPLKPHYLFGKQLPFTPGIIPKEKDRIAKNIGQVISGELINEETLTKTLKKEEIYTQIYKKIDGKIAEYESCEQSIESFLGEWMTSEKLEEKKKRLKEHLVNQLNEQIADLNLGAIIIEKIAEQLKGVLSGPLAFFINDRVIDDIAAKMEEPLSQALMSEAKPLLEKLVEKQGQNILNKPLSELIKSIKPDESRLKEIISTLYDKLVIGNMPRILEVLDISNMVAEKIMAYDPLEFEKIILSLVKKELNAIIWLGALLGLIMGCVTNLL